MNSKITKNDPTLKRILMQCYSSTRYFSKVFYPDRFHLPFSSLHDEIFTMLDKSKSQKKLVLAPRGFGKTSISTISFPSKKILFREAEYIMPVSSSSTLAEMQSENLKTELLSNPIIGKLFGNLKSKKFSAHQWITSSGICVMPRGSGQQVRGLLYGNKRPDLIIVDDLENSENVRSEEQREKLKEWFFSDLLNCVDRSSDKWQVVVIGTLLHEDALLANLMEDPSWDKIILSICDDNGKSNWPDFMSDEQIQELYDYHKFQGLTDKFYQEYRNIPIAKDDAVFQQSFFKYYSETELPPDVKARMETVVLLDPAKSVKAQSDFTGIIGIGVDTRTGSIYIRDLINKRIHPDEIIEQTFTMAIRLNATAIGIEVTSLNEFIMYPIRTRMTQLGRGFELIELKARSKKEERIASLSTFYRRGAIYHNSTVTVPLEAQLLSFPRSKYDDAMDAEAYIVEMLQLGGRFFQPSYAGEDDYGQSDETDKAFEKLSDDYLPAITPSSRGYVDQAYENDETLYDDWMVL